MSAYKKVHYKTFVVAKFIDEDRPDFWRVPPEYRTQGITDFRNKVARRVRDERAITRS